MIENYKTYGKNKIASFGGNGTSNNIVSIYSNDDLRK
jgi:hypothetical protein